VTHSTTSAGPRRSVWVWALVGLWFVACLNPMPDDFPNEREADRDSFTPRSPEDDIETDPASSPDVAGSGGDGSLNGAPAGEPGSPPAAAGAGGTGGGVEADAGPPEADAGP
jgi:hypothetical protein